MRKNALKKGVLSLKPFKHRWFQILMVALLALPVCAQTPAGTSDAQPQEARIAQYKSFVDKLAADPAGAYEIGKAFVNKYPSPDDQYLQYVKNWVVAYEA